jgi:hypothetical protein
MESILRDWDSIQADAPGEEGGHRSTGIGDGHHLTG